MEEGLLLCHTLSQGVYCCQPGSCIKWLYSLTVLEQEVLQNLVPCFQLATVFGQKESAKQPCRKRWSVVKTIFIPTVPSAHLSQVSLGWVWGRCLWRAGFSPGGTAPTWSPEMRRKATTQRAGQVLVAGPFTRATYPVVSPCPQQLLKGGNVIRSRDGRWTIPQGHNWSFLFLFRCWSLLSTTSSFPKRTGGFIWRVEQYMSSFSPLNMKVMSDSRRIFHSKKISRRNLKRNHSQCSGRGVVGWKGMPLWSLPCQEPGLLAPVMLGKTQLHQNTHFWGQGSCHHRDEAFPVLPNLSEKAGYSWVLWAAQPGTKKMMAPTWHQPKHLSGPGKSWVLLLLRIKHHKKYFLPFKIWFLEHKGL